MPITSRARKWRWSSVVAASACFAGALAPNCAPLDSSGKLRCENDGDCVGGYTCCSGECIRPSLCCDGCSNESLYRNQCYIVDDTGSELPELNPPWGFSIIETGAQFDEYAEYPLDRPGVDLDCSVGIESLFDSGAQGDELGACGTTVAGERPPLDPANGVDNSFVRTFIPRLLGAGNEGDDTITTSSAGWRMLILLSDYNGAADDAKVSVSIVYADRSRGLNSEELDASKPDDQREWGIRVPDSYTIGHGPWTIDREAYVKDHRVYSKFAQHGGDSWIDLLLFVHPADGEPARLKLQIRKPVLTFRLTTDEYGRISRLEDGVFSGIWYETQWPDGPSEYERVLANVGSVAGGGARGGAGGSAGQAGDAQAAAAISSTAAGGAFSVSSSPSSGSGALTDGAEAPAESGEEGVVEGAAVFPIPFEETFGRDAVLAALATSFDSYYFQVNSSEDPEVCTAVSFALGLRGMPVEFSCPTSMSIGSGVQATDSMAEYGQCQL